MRHPHRAEEVDVQERLRLVELGLLGGAHHRPREIGRSYRVAP